MSAADKSKELLAKLGELGIQLLLKSDAEAIAQYR